MGQSYFNSNIDSKYYHFLKKEAIDLNLTIKKHIANILTDYVERSQKRKEELPRLKRKSCSYS
jgi:hypothetical protein